MDFQSFIPCISSEYRCLEHIFDAVQRVLVRYQVFLKELACHLISVDRV